MGRAARPWLQGPVCGKFLVEDRDRGRGANKEGGEGGEGGVEGGRGLYLCQYI